MQHTTEVKNTLVAQQVTYVLKLDLIVKLQSKRGT